MKNTTIEYFLHHTCQKYTPRRNGKRTEEYRPLQMAKSMKKQLFDEKYSKHFVSICVLADDIRHSQNVIKLGKNLSKNS